jgi:glycosyltransferase involved in cell wall biosynthesis
MPKLLRLSTDPLTFKLQLSGQSKFLKEQGWEVLLVSADGRMIPQLVAAEGVAHAVIPFVKESSVIDDFICFWELVQLFKREKPDVVHSHGAKAGFLGMLASSFVGIPHRVHTLSEMPKQAYEGTKEMSLTFREKWTFSKASEVWVNSLGLLNLFTSNELVPAAKLKLLAKGSSNGVDLSRFNRNTLQENHLVAATMRMMPGENDYVILAVGNLSKKKGVEELVTAFLSSKIVSKSKLVFLGSLDQDNDPISQETLQSLREHPRIVQIDWTNHVAHHLALADVLVHASHQEGFSNVLLEAAALQVPIICSDCLGNASLITQKKTGLIFPVGEVSVLKEALEFAFVKRELMADFADCLHAEVEEHFDQKIVHQALLANYQRLLQEQPVLT